MLGLAVAVRRCRSEWEYLRDDGGEVSEVGRAAPPDCLSGGREWAEREGGKKRMRRWCQGLQAA